MIQTYDNSHPICHQKANETRQDCKLFIILTEQSTNTQRSGIIETTKPERAKAMKYCREEAGKLHQLRLTE